MKLIVTSIILSAAYFIPTVQAQPARVDYSQPGQVWTDQSGAPSRQTGYDGTRPYDGSVAQSRANVRDDARPPQVDTRVGQQAQGVGLNPNQLNVQRRQWRDNRRGVGWDQNLHNGYYNSRNQWRYGRPTGRQMRQPSFAMGYRPWTRGQSLGVYNSRFAAIDHRSYNLRAPPRGYRWVQDDRGDYLLAATVGGLIARVVVNSPR